MLSCSHGDTLVFRNMYALSVAYVMGLRVMHQTKHQSTKIHITVATGIIYC